MQRTTNNVWKKQYRHAVLLVLLFVLGLIVVTVMTETLAGDGPTTDGFPFPRRGVPEHTVGTIALDGDPDLVLDVLAHVAGWSGLKRAFTKEKVSDEEIEELRNRLSQAANRAERRNVRVALVPATLANRVLTLAISTGEQSTAQSLVVHAVSPVEMPAAVATTKAAEPPRSAKPSLRRLATAAPPPRSVSAPASVPVFPFPRQGTPRHKVERVVIHGDPETVQLLADAVGTWTQVEDAVTSTAVSDEEITEIGRMLLRAGRSAGYPETEIAYFPKMLSVGSLTYRARTGNRSVAVRGEPLSAPKPDALPTVAATSLPAAKPLASSVVTRHASGKPAPAMPAATATAVPPTGAEVAPTVAPPVVAAATTTEVKAPLSRPPEVDEILRRGMAPAPVPAGPAVSTEVEETCEPPAVTAIAPDLPRVPEALPSPPDTETPMPWLVVTARSAGSEDGRRLWWPFARRTSPDEPIVTATESKPITEKPRRWRLFGGSASSEKTIATTVEAKPVAEEPRRWWSFRRGASSEEAVAKAADEEATTRKPSRLRWPSAGRSDASELPARAETQAIAVPTGDTPAPVSVTLLQATSRTVTPAEVAQGSVVRRTRR